MANCEMGNCAKAMLLLSIAVLLSFSVFADTLTTNGDTAVWNLQPDTNKNNYGTESPTWHTVDRRHVYMMFDFSNVTGDITNLMLNLSYAERYTTGTTKNLSFYYCDDTFDETTITWNNQFTEVVNCDATPVYTIALAGLPGSGLPGNGSDLAFNMSGLVPKILNDSNKLFTIWAQVEPVGGVTAYWGWYENGVLMNNYSQAPFFWYSSTVNEPPVVTIIDPPNGTMSGSQRNITYRATDNYTTMNCSLLVDDIFTQSNSTVLNNTLSKFSPIWTIGTHEYEIFCSGGVDTGSSGRQTFTFNSSHNIILYTPDNATRTNTQDPVEFEVYDSDNLTTVCQLYVDSVLNATNSTVRNDTVTYFYPVWSPGVHTWNVRCNDTFTLTTSETRIFDYDASAPFISLSSPSPFNTTIFSAGTMLLKGNVTDNNLWRVMRTIYYPNGSIFYQNYSGDLPAFTTIYSFADTFNTTTMPNGFYRAFIEGTDSHTAEHFADAIDVNTDVDARKLTYVLPYDTVSVEMTGGDLAEAVTDVQTEKLDDRYTFQYDFDSPIEEGQTAVYHVTSTEPIIYLEDSEYKGHFILAEKYWLDFENYNGDVTVAKVNDYDYEVTVTITESSGAPEGLPGRNQQVGQQNQPEGLSDNALKFNSLGGLNEANLSVTFEILNCHANWQCNGYSACSINDNATCNSVSDLNTCGDTYLGDYSEFAGQSCNYCNPSYGVVSGATCNGSYRNSTITMTNFATCCNVTNKRGDDCMCNSDNHDLAWIQNCLQANASITASTWYYDSTGCIGYQSQYTAGDAFSAANDAFVKAIIAIGSVVGLIVLIFVIMWGFKKLTDARHK